MSGVIPYLPTRRLSQQELDTCDRYDMTSEAKREPYDPVFAEREERIPSPLDAVEPIAPDHDLLHGKLMV